MRAASVLPLPVIWFIGRIIGEGFYRLHRKRRRIVEINIATCFRFLNHQQQQVLVRRHFHAFGQALLDIGLPWWASPERIRRLVKFRDLKYYQAALKANKHIILLAPHFLSLEMGGIRLSQDRPMVTMFRHPSNELFRIIFEQQRQRFKLQLIEHIEGLRPVIREIQAGKPFYYLPDQDAGPKNSIFVPFFGNDAATFAVIGRLAKLTDAVVIPCATRQLPRGGGYEIIFKPPFENFPSGDDVKDTRRMNQAIEQCVLDMPEQYFWVHKRFKTQPEGEPDFYVNVKDKAD